MAIINDKAALFGAAARKEDVAEIGVSKVRIVEVGALDDQAIRAKVKDIVDGAARGKRFIEELVACSVVDADGNPFLTADDFKDLSREAQYVLAAKVMQVNGMLAADGGEKNSEASQEESSPSGSL